MPRNFLDGFRTSQRLQHNNVFSPSSEEMYHITKAGRTGATARKQRSPEVSNKPLEPRRRAAVPTRTRPAMCEQEGTGNEVSKPNKQMRDQTTARFRTPPYTAHRRELCKSDQKKKSQPQERTAKADNMCNPPIGP